MVWICLPQTFEIPGVLSIEGGGVWACPDRGLVAFVGSSVSIVANGALPCVKAGSATLAIADTLYSGKSWFGAGSGTVVFYSAIREAWICRNGYVPVEPVLQTDPDTGNVSGDAWFESSSFDPSPFSGSVASFSAKGTASGSMNVQPWWPRWTGQKSSSQGLAPFRGTFSAQDGATPSTITIGSPTWNRIVGSTSGPYFQHRSGGEWVAPSSGAKIVPASDVFPDDTSGDYVFSDDTGLRLRSLPSDTTARENIYRIVNGSYVSAGRLQGGIVAVVLARNMDSMFVSAPALWK